ncbi:hypothetical protein LUX33_20845 [Actinomadura madurae]|uniref:hypothetical protein n=1 Tax=Actinomadura madurae TaxID=1993 RepID=UPI0020D25F0B|nr:hypothetical protein [Actinomadura madurae]MCP9950612.1 hypothetical protein [Actinomadura madurae]
MRRRLLLSTLAVAVVAILLLGIPLAYIAHKLVYEEAGRSLDREASSIAGRRRLPPGVPPAGHRRGDRAGVPRPGTSRSRCRTAGRSPPARPGAAASCPPRRRTARSGCGCRARRRRSATRRCGGCC